MAATSARDRISANSDHARVPGRSSGSDAASAGSSSSMRLGFERVVGQVRAATDHEGQRDQRNGQQRGRRQPQHRGGGVERRTVEDEVAVAIGHVAADLLGRLAALEHLAHLLAQVDGEVGVRVGDGLVLAHQAAQFAR